MKVRERSRLRGKEVEGGESEQITPNSVSDWLEWGMLGGREVMQHRLCQQGMPSGCVSLLFYLFLFYLFIRVSAGAAIGRAGRAEAGFIYFLSDFQGIP